MGSGVTGAGPRALLLAMMGREVERGAARILRPLTEGTTARGP